MIFYNLFVTVGTKAMPCLNAEEMALGRIYFTGGILQCCVNEDVNI